MKVREAALFKDDPSSSPQLYFIIPTSLAGTRYRARHGYFTFTLSVISRCYRSTETFFRMTKDGLRKVTKKEMKVEESHRSRWEVSRARGLKLT